MVSHPLVFYYSIVQEKRKLLHLLQTAECAVPTAVGKRMDTKVSTLLNPASFAC